MTVNLNQYRWTVGVFNNRKLPLKKPHGPSLHKTHLIEVVIFLLLPTVRYGISLSSAQNIRFLRRSHFHSLYFMSVLSYIHYVWLYSLAIKLSGDIEENPGPKPNSSDCLSICHWNLNSISAHNFIKLSVLRAYIYIKVSGNPCDHHNQTSTIWKKKAFTTFSLFLCTNRDWKL